MVQYLLNATLIWLFSLVVFDLFLGRQTFHMYNRTYLLGTFIIGILLPLVAWQTPANIHAGNISQKITAINTTKATLVAKATPSIIASNIERWLWIIYVTGACVMVVMLMIEVSKLIVLYRSGRKWKEGKWTIIATGREHGPFSLFRMMFVSGACQYSESEWNILLTHEQQHSRLLHFADIVLMQLARIVFWFHPLVYAYNKRLLLIHEYQADKAANTNAPAYGRFLIHQSMFGTAPIIAHTFNRSPIKKRIVMLTHHSKRTSHISKLIVIPMTLLFLVFCTKTLYSQGKTDNAVSAAIPSGTDTLRTTDNTAHGSSSKQTTSTDTTQKKSIPFLPMTGC